MAATSTDEVFGTRNADAWNNDVMGTATVRDDDPGRNDFATTWAVYELSVAANPAPAKGRAATQG